MISIVVPVVSAKWLPGFFRTLPMACSGLDEPVEVIILDNGCEERSLSYGYAFQTCVVYHDPPVSFHAGWNAGARLAAGDVVIIANDDILWGWRSVTNLCAALSLHNLICCYPTPAVSEAALGLADVNADEPPHLVGPPEFRGWCHAWTRAGLEAVGLWGSRKLDKNPFDERFELFYGDDDAWMQTIDLGSPARQVHNAWVYHIGSQSVRELAPEYVREAKARDKARFDMKWGRSPRELLAERAAR
jgi:GT2 family glycosyltransferase